MKLVCTADPRAWAEVKDVWTRNDIKRYNELLSGGDVAALRAFYAECIKDACVVDIAGQEYQGIEAIFGAEDMGDLDAAVAAFWLRLPWLAYSERQKLGEAKRSG